MMGAPKGTIEERFWRKVIKCGPIPSHKPELGMCWTWVGYVDTNGYGRLAIKKNGQDYAESAHRISWKLHKGIIPDGLQIDHLCRNRSCPNPSHFESVTSRENTLRGVTPSVLTYLTNICQRGHKNSFYKRPNGKRYCTICSLEKQRKRNRESRQRGNAQ